MYSNLFSELLALSVAGLGLMGIGVCQLLGAKFSAWVRFAGSLAVVLGSVAGVAAFAPEAKHAWWTATILGSALIVGSAAFWSSSAAVASRFLSICRRPVAQGAVAVVLGLSIISLSVAKFDNDDQQILEEGMAHLELINARPMLYRCDFIATTDTGTEIKVSAPQEPREQATVNKAEADALSGMALDQKVLRVQRAGDHSNCHGWVFTGGKYWVDGPEVELILKENGYRAVSQPQSGDLAIYRDQQMISHTAIVRYVAPNQPVLVEGKWGWMGVYMHAVNQSCYGIDVTYYRSPRDGHLVVGFGGSPTSNKEEPVSPVRIQSASE